MTLFDPGYSYHSLGGGERMHEYFTSARLCVHSNYSLTTAESKQMGIKSRMKRDRRGGLGNERMGEGGTKIAAHSWDARFNGGFSCQNRFQSERKTRQPSGAHKILWFSSSGFLHLDSLSILLGSIFGYPLTKLCSGPVMASLFLCLWGWNRMVRITPRMNLEQVKKGIVPICGPQRSIQRSQKIACSLVKRYDARLLLCNKSRFPFQFVSCSSRSKGGFLPTFIRYLSLEVLAISFFCWGSGAQKGAKLSDDLTKTFARLSNGLPKRRIAHLRNRCKKRSCARSYREGKVEMISVLFLLRQEPDTQKYIFCVKVTRIHPFLCKHGN